VADAQLHVITHVDVIPPRTADGTQLLQEHARKLHGVTGLVRCELLRQVFKKNHFELLTVWESRDAYDAHLASTATREFREQLHPMLGSPIDDRLHELLVEVG
jgi:quinol monooxygenase YgiN